METTAAGVGRGEDAIRRHVQRTLRELMTDNRPHTGILTVPRHELFGELLRQILVETAPARVDREIAAVDPTEISQTGAKGGKETLIFGAVFGRCHEDADATQARNLLRARHERPCGYAAADQRDEIPSPHRSPSSGKAYH